ncbi:MAG: M20 family metallopeptidase [Gemmatales bacterium]|nr:M20 family metallopeptidase [Gemmatales bacterium]MDW8388003.1 M20 family metallopeptidase [Gemmatales bacterium]
MTEAVRLLSDLVRIPSINPMGRPYSGPEYLETRLTAYLEQFFRELGVRYERQPVAPKRDNILAYYDAPGAVETLMFEAHQDTVPAENMTIDPFGAVIENGRLYGRGACDIKGGLAAMLAAFARLVREKPRHGQSVIMACAVDEEFTFRGITEIVLSGLRPDFAVVAEPTGLDIVNAHKGVVRWNLRTSGRACHSSQPENGVNAIYRMARLLRGIEEYAEWLSQHRVDPSLGPATLSVGRIEGGTSVNVVPDWCRIEIDRRVVGGEDATRAPEELAAFLRGLPDVDFDFETEPPWMCKQALEPKENEELVRRLARVVDRVRGRHVVRAVPYGTDASTLAEAGIPTVVFGPGDIANAHTKDEWVSVEEVEQAAEILFHLAARE